jgi:hypothetical protein
MPNNCKFPEMCLLSETCVPCAICPNATRQPALCDALVLELSADIVGQNEKNAAEVIRLRAAIRNLRDVKGRHHTQIACERLFALLPENADVDASAPLTAPKP